MICLNYVVQIQDFESLNYFNYIYMKEKGRIHPSYYSHLLSYFDYLLKIKIRIKYLGHVGFLFFKIVL